MKGSLDMVSNRRDRFFGRASEYASVQDFCRVFHQDMNVLYWLALTLTGDEREAEQCFVAGLEECIAGNSVFKEWAGSWSRRVVIKNAIRRISPRPSATNKPTAIRVPGKAVSQAQAAQVALTSLPPFERFVFVMAVLEGYADLDCVTLLECTATDLIKARFKALQQIQRAIDLSPVSQEDRGGEPRETVVFNDAQAA
jgi:DNA-directed RNA polymerase specialized sigma24 family protein